MRCCSARRHPFTAFLPILLSCLLSTHLFAQKNEVSFSVGGLISTNQSLGNNISVCPVNLPNCNPPISISTDTGVAFEGTFARQMFKFGPASLDVEVPLLGAPGRDLHFGGSPTGTPVSSLFFTPSARVRFFRSKAISPFASVGGGLAHFGFQGGDRNTGALQYGGGLDFKTPLPHVAFRAEARDFYAAGATQSTSLVPVSPLRQHNVFVGGGAVLRF